ncbi:GntR family transcriptional regulator [Sansalvadorimonas verongulae]|uniref:GntR family transcriptional regulator n=1 Tax=Sansalvadorimonas verongulae TaxID=2172824 RepID=UPI0012BC22A1|nr:GntR family transcriptional regulator [Sansalvadorimonas verongulae]MTI13666.1 GntR family transcriptional regulator [Sansalvadorimonas verongulae]
MKISKQSLEEQAANFLRQQILDGVYKSGEKLVESMLAKELDLSRTTMRMALNTLSSEGLVFQKPYAGWQVITLGDDDLWELYHLRVALEGQSAEMAAERINDEKRVRLRAKVREFIALCEQKETTLTEVSYCDMDLHKLIVECGESPRMAKVYNRVSNQLIIYLHMTHLDYSIRDSARSHVPLVEAICAGNIAEAGRCARSSISTYAELCHSYHKNLREKTQHQSSQAYSE